MFAKKNISMKEIKSRQDIEEMVNAFYDKVNNDPILSPVFNEIVKVDWLTHLPKMYSFWDTLLLGAQSYRGKPFDHHLPLPLSEKHFKQWVALFLQTLDERYTGDVAEDARQKAINIAGVFKFKMYSLGALKDEG